MIARQEFFPLWALVAAVVVALALLFAVEMTRQADASDPDEEEPDA